MSSSSILDDYGTRYEQLLLEQRQLQSIASKYLTNCSTTTNCTAADNYNHHSNNDTGNTSNCATTNGSDATSASIIASSMTSNRVAMLGMIQSTIQDARRKKKEDGENEKQKKHNPKSDSQNTNNNNDDDDDDDDDDNTIQGLTCLLEHTLEQQRFGDYRQNVIYKQNETNRNNSRHANSKADANASADPYMNLWTLASIERNNNTSGPFFNNNQSKEVEENADDNDDDSDIDNDIDLFFKMYPECQAYNKVQVFNMPSLNNNDNHNINFMNNNITPQSNNITNFKKRKDVHYSYKNNNDNNNHHKENSHSNSSNDQQHPTLANPYLSSDHQNPKRQSKTMPMETTTTSTSQSWDAYNAKQSQQRGGYHNISSSYQHPHQPQYHSFDYDSLPQHQQINNDNSNMKNSFCTANEFKKQEQNNKNHKHHNGYNNHNNYDYNLQSSSSSTTTCNPYHHQNNNTTTLQHNPNRPVLSGGLKRKFQIPRLGGNNNSGSNNNNNNSSNGNTNQISRPSTSVQNIKSSNNTNATVNNSNNDDDLPEALKGLDKELISKIENEIVDNGDPITFQDIAGLEDAKQTVQELVCWPMKRPDLFEGLRRGPNGLLLFGPPGTGKTLIGKAIAHESGATFFSISSSSLTSKWIGEGEKLVRTLFAVAAYNEPAVVFIDEIDSLLTQRKADENEASRRIKTEFLVQLDGTGTSGQGRVLAIGATNRPNELDDAARRRFVKRLYIPLPEESDRVSLLNTLLAKNKNSLSTKDISKIACETKGFSGADLKALCTDAALGPIRELGSNGLENIHKNDVPPISYRHFKRSLRGMKPSVAESDLELYHEWNATYGSKSIAADEYAGLSDDDDEEEGGATEK